MEGGRLRKIALTVLLATCAWAPAQATAGVQYTVKPGETLWSIAAAHNFGTRSFAAVNGLSVDAHVVAGSTLTIPTVQEAADALARVGDAQASPTRSDSGQAAAPPALGGYTVRPGDTLSHLATRSGVSVGQMAAMNGLDPSRPLLAGTVIKLPPGAPAPPRAAEPAPPPRVTHAHPHPTPEKVSAEEIGQVAAQHAVPGSLAKAVAWQESGFQNHVISSANARGVMQILPGTWDWIQDSLATWKLNPSSAHDNVHAGSLYLGQLLRDNRGDPMMAAASYYQGLASVRKSGLFDETKRYVDNIRLHQRRFGG